MACHSCTSSFTLWLCVILLVVCRVASQGVVIPDEPVRCYSSDTCAPNSLISFELITFRECCTNTTGLSATSLNQEGCSLCIVYGWEVSQFTGIEREEPYTVSVVLLKGLSDLFFSNPIYNVVLEPGGDATEGVDFTFDQVPGIIIRDLQDSPSPVVFSLILDGVAEEPLETFALSLELVQGFESQNAFITRRLEIGIIDGDLIAPPTQTTPPAATTEQTTLSVFECQRLDAIEMCMLVYENGSFPNLRNHTDQNEAAQELLSFTPIIQRVCSNAVVHFLCSFYAPFCQFGIRVRPCRELCAYVRSTCELPLTELGLEWPPFLECDEFLPDATTDLDFCPPNFTLLQIPPNVPTDDLATATTDIQVQIGFEMTEYTVQESDGSATVTVVLVSNLGPPEFPLIFLSLITRDGTATAPDDYASTQEALSFAGPSLSVSIPIEADTVEETDETFTVRLVPEVGQDLTGVLISPAVATITIINTVQTVAGCHESRGCRGDLLPGISEGTIQSQCCVAGGGLSYRETDSGQCQECFSDQTFAAEGNKFYFGLFSNFEPSPYFEIGQIHLFVNPVSTAQTDFTLTLAGTTTRYTAPREVSMDSDDVVIDADSIRDRSVVVRSVNGDPITAVAYAEEFTSSDTFKVLPCVSLPVSAYEYYAVSVPLARVPSPDYDVGDYDYKNDDDFRSPEGNSAIVIVTTEKDTELTITLSRNVTVTAEDLLAQVPGGMFVEGVPVRVSLPEEAQTLYIGSIRDLTGSKVTSNRPIAFMSGHECGTIPVNFEFCDQLLEQFPPTATWGKTFLTSPIQGRDAYDLFKVVASEDDTLVTISCTGNQPFQALFLQSGEFSTMNISSFTFCYIQSTLPILVVQFSIVSSVDDVISGDPFMVIIPPLEQYRSSYNVNTFTSSLIGLTDVNYVNLLVPEDVDPSGILLNGEPIEAEFVPIPCGEEDEGICGRAAQVNIPSAQHLLSHSTPSAVFNAIVYSTSFRVGSGYFAGMTQRPIALPSVSFTIESYEVTENDTTVDIMLTRSGDMSTSGSFSIKTLQLSSGNAAVVGEDYEALDTEIQFSPDQTDILVSINIVDDVFPEDTEQLMVILTASPDVYIDSPASAIVTIFNDDPELPVMIVSFADVSVEVTEGVGLVSFLLLKTAGALGPVSVQVATIDQSAEDGADYISLNETITFDIEDREVMVQTLILDNSAVEDVEQFLVFISPVVGLFPVAVQDSTAVVTITDDDVATIGFTQFQHSFDESGETFVAIEVLQGSLEAEVTVIVSSDDGTAQAPLDYRGVQETLTFSASTTQHLTFPSFVPDTLVEQDEFYTLNLRFAEERNLSVQLLPDEARVVIVDDDEAVIGLQSELTALSEGEGSARFSVNVIDGGLSQPVTVRLLAVGNTATAGADFAVTNTTVSVTDSEEVLIQILDDPLYEDTTEMFTVIASLEDGVFGNRVRLIPSFIDINIEDNDVLPVATVGFSSASYSVSEGSEAATLVVVSDGLNPGPVSLEYFYVSGTAQNGVDIEVRRTTLEFAAGSTVATISVPITEDTLAEPSEDFTVMLVPLGETAVLIDVPSTTVTVTDNDAVEVAFEQNAYLVNEGEQVTLLIRQFGEAFADVCVSVSTQSGTAVELMDFEPFSIIVCFPAGEFDMTVPVATMADDILEADSGEMFLVRLGHLPTNTVPVNITQGATAVLIVDAPLTLPTAPLNLACSTTTTSINCTWSQSPSDTVTNYILNWLYTGPCEIDTESFMLGAEVRGYVLMGLEEGGDYTVTLNAVNSAGQGPPASTRVMTLIAEPSGAPRAVAAIMLSSTSALIQWEPVECLEQNGEIRNYQVVIQAVDMPPVVFFSEGTSVTVTDLFPGVEYIVRVSGTNVGGGGPSSEFVSFMLIEENECLSDDTNNCHGNATCFDTVESFICVCDQGFSGDGVTCIDIDECLFSNSTCDFNAVCVNTPGSFECICFPGYSGDGFECTDIDECSEGLNDCDVNAMCFEDMPGGFECSCLEGFTGNGRTCSDIDECEEGTNNCDPNANCTNIAGSFTCTCEEGFIGNGTTCTPAGVMLLVLDTMLTAVEPDVRETVNVTACYTASILQPLERDAEFEFVLISENSTATLSLDFFVPELDRPVLVIPSGEAGEYFRCINVTIIGDDEVEGDEVAVYELVPVDDRDAVLFPSDTMEIVITIIDNDNIIVGFDSARYSVAEGGEVTITVELSAPAIEAVSVDLSTIEGTAGNEDYISTTNSIIFFNAGDRSREFTLTTVEDEIAEPTETFQVRLSNPNGLELGEDLAIVEIADNDELILQLDPTTYEVMEGGEAISLNLTFNAVVDTTVRVRITTAPGTASDEDYQSVDQFIGITVLSTLVSLPTPVIVDDEFAELPETFFFVLSQPSAEGIPVSIGEQNTAVITILDDDFLFIEFENGTEFEVQEGTEVAIPYSLTSPADRSLSVQLVITDITTTAEDYVLVADSFAIPAGVTSGIIALTANFDEVFEGTEQLEITLMSTSEGLDVGENGAVIVSILESIDFTVGLDSEGYTVTEGAPVQINILLSVPAVFPVSVDLEIVEFGSAAAPMDYQDVNLTITFPPGITLRTVRVNTTDDDVYEDTEVFIVLLSNPTELLRVVNGIASVEIMDNDMIVVGFEQDLYEVTEGTPEVVIILEVLNGTIGEGVQVPVNLTTEDDTATSFEDFLPNTELVLLSADMTSANFSVTILDNDEVEETEFFLILVVETGSGRIALAQEGTEVAITDDDMAFVELEFNMTEYTVQESDGSVTLTVVLVSGEEFLPVSLFIQTEDGTARAPDDYTAVQQLTNFSGAPLSVSIPIEVDSIEEPDETFTVILLPDPDESSRGIVYSLGMANITIVDSPPEPDVQIGFDMTEYTVQESDGSVTVTVAVLVMEREFPPVLLSLITEDGTAIARADYTMIQQTLGVFFAPVLVSIPIEADSVLEPDETFTVRLVPAPGQNLEGILISPDMATITIVDSPPPEPDVVIGFNATEYTVEESDGSVSVTVELVVFGREFPPLSLLVTTEDGTAIAPDDYAITQEMISFFFDPVTVSIPIVFDSIEEPNENFTVSLIPALGQNLEGFLFSPDVATITIVDSPPPEPDSQIGFNMTEYTVQESDGSVSVTVVFVSGTEFSSIFFNVITENGTATDPDDYEFISSLIVPPEIVSIPIVFDNIEEPDETFTVRLVPIPDQNLEGILISPDVATITIINTPVDVQIGFGMLEYTVQESDGSVSVTVELLVFDREFPQVSLTVITGDGSAIAPDDYTSTEQTITSFFISPETVSIPIVLDSIEEQNETFTVRLIPAPGENLGDILISPDTATVTIVDLMQPSEVRIGFEEAEYTAFENSTLFVTIELVSGADFPPIDLFLTTQDGTATAPDDYATTQVGLTFTGQPITVNIPIVSDAIEDPDETFIVRLILEEESDGILIIPDVTTVTIIDVCSDGQLRLVGFNDQMSGRLEICRGGVWGGVCNNNWDDTDAMVVCRQLGFSEQGAQALFEVPPADIPAFVDNVQCLGTEPRLDQCVSDTALPEICDSFVGASCQVSIMD